MRLLEFIFSIFLVSLDTTVLHAFREWRLSINETPLCVLLKTQIPLRSISFCAAAFSLYMLIYAVLLCFSEFRRR